MPDGTAFSTTDVRHTVRRMASACGEQPTDFGASSLRAGGATDLREGLGDDDRSSRIIKQRGRWASDIAEIYQRALLRTQLDASAAIGTAAIGAAFINAAVLSAQLVSQPLARLGRLDGRPAVDPRQH